MHSAPIMAAPTVQQSVNVAETSHKKYSNNAKLSVLTKIFGHTSFRGKQEDAINAILNCENRLSVLPTGAGKSICYSVQGLIFGGVTVIICPLLSLMMHKVNLFGSEGFNVCYLNSSVPQIIGMSLYTTCCSIHQSTMSCSLP